MNIANLKPTTIYTVQVESRKELKRSEDLTGDYINSDILN